MKKRTFPRFCFRFLAVSFLLSALSVFGAEVKVFTSFGKSLVTPEARTATIGENIQFTAPLYIYLDNEFNEVSSTPANIREALYRARCSGYTMSDGQSTILGVGDASQGKLEILKKIDVDLSITWQWEIQYALDIDSGTTSILPGEGNRGLGQPDPVVGKLWVSHGTALSPSVDGSVNADAAGARFRIKGAEVQGLTAIVDGEVSKVPSDKEDRYFSWNDEDMVFIDNLKDGSVWGRRTIDNLPQSNFRFERPAGYTAGQLDNVHVLDFWFNNLGVNQWKDAPDIPVNDNQFKVELATIVHLYNSDAPFRDEFGTSFVESYRGEFAMRRSDGGVSNDRFFGGIPKEAVSPGWHHMTVITEFTEVDTPTNGRYTVLYLLDGREVDREIIENFDKSKRLFAKRINGVRIGSTGLEGTTVSQQAGLTEVNDLRLWSLSNTESSLAVRLGGSRGVREDLATKLGGNPSALNTFLPLSSNLAPVFEESFDSESNNLRFPQARRLELPEVKSFNFDNVSDRAVLPQLLVTGPMKVEWKWDKELRYRIGALDQNAAAFGSDVFLSVYPKGTPLAAVVNNTVAPAIIHQGAGDYWLENELVAWVGAGFRTSDRRRTLADFIGQPSGDLGRVGRLLSSTRDARTPGGGSARAHYVGDVQLPTTVNWSYDRTRFQAFVPLGDGLNATWQSDHDNNPATPAVDMSPLPANVQLIPDLPDGTRLKVDREGPSLRSIIDNSTPGTSRAGEPFQWDFVGQQLLPVQPYRFELDWAAAGDAETFLVEIVSGWPGDEVTLDGSFALAGDGNRVVAQGDPIKASRGDNTSRSFTDESLRVMAGSPLETKITVSGLSGSEPELIDSVAFEINGVTHEELGDMHVILIPPGGSEADGFYLLGNQNSGSVTNSTFTFSSAVGVSQVTPPLAFAGASVSRSLASLANTLATPYNGDWTVKVADDLDRKTGSVGGYKLTFVTRPTSKPSVVSSFNAGTPDYALPLDGYRTFDAVNDIANSRESVLGIEVEFTDFLWKTSGGKYDVILEGPNSSKVILARGMVAAVASPSPVTFSIAHDATTIFDPSSITGGTRYGTSGAGTNIGELLVNTNLQTLLAEFGRGAWRVHIAEPADGSGAIAYLGQVNLKLTTLPQGQASNVNRDLRLLPVNVASPSAPYTFGQAGYTRIDLQPENATGNVVSVSVAMNGLKPSAAGGDFDMVLESPDGKLAYLAKGNSAAPGSTTPVNVIFKDGGAAFSPVSMTDGTTYAPTVLGGTTVDGTIGTTLSSLAGAVASGTWRVHFLGGNTRAIESVGEITLTVFTDEFTPFPELTLTNAETITDNNLISRTQTLVAPSGVDAASAKLTSLELVVRDLAHTHSGDIVIGLRAPNGKIVELFNGTGGGADFTGNDLTFSFDLSGVKGAANSLNPPYTDRIYRSADSTANRFGGNAADITNFASLAGTQAFGNWTFFLFDAATGDEGTLSKVTLSGTYDVRRPKGDVVTPPSLTLSGAQAINDNQTITQTQTLSVPAGVDASNAVVTGLVLTVNDLSHTYSNDVAIALRAPNGKTVELFSRTGASADFTGNDLTFLLNASGVQGAASSLNPPYSDRVYRSADTTTNHFGGSAADITNFASLAGTTPFGDWTFLLLDGVGGDQGSFASVTLGVSYTVARAEVETVKPSLFRTAIPQNAQVQNLDFSGLTGVVDALTLQVDHSGPFKGETLHIALQAPDGTVIPLMANAAAGAAFDGSYPLRFSTLATQPMPSSGLPSSGVSFQPGIYGSPFLVGLPSGGSIGDFLGKDPNGTWKVYYAFDQPRSGGDIDTRLELSVKPSITPTTSNFTETGGAVPDKSGSVVTTFSPDQYILPVTGFSSRQVITDVNVTLNGLRHEEPSELQIALRSPSGKCVYLLAESFGASGAMAATNLQFDDEADHFAPFSGSVGASLSLRPTLNGFAVLKDSDQDGVLNSGQPFEDVLSVFDGESPNGGWTLIVGDTRGHSVGGLDNGFSIEFEVSELQENAATGIPVYSKSVSLPAVKMQFPASPAAHYSYLFSSQGEKTPALEFDNNPSDRWAFQNLSFSELENPNVSQIAPFEFQANRSGRSVVVYSYRPNAGDVANGDAEREAFAVRVIQGESLDTALAVPAANRRVPQLTNSQGRILPLAAVTAASLTLSDAQRLAIEDAGFAIDFRMNVSATGVANASLFQLAQPGYQLALVPGQVSGRQDFQLTVPSGTSTRVLTIPQIETLGWHHYWLNIIPVSGGVGYEFYQDGILVASSGAVVTRRPVSGDLSLFSGFSDWNVGVDNLRVWGKSVAASVVRERLQGFAVVGSDPDLIAGTNFDPITGSNDFAAAPFSLTVGATAASSSVSPFAMQEIANPLTSAFDLAGFGSGWIVNQVSNYNAGIYDRESGVGQWGTIFPVNDDTLYQPTNRQLEVVYYQNPGLDHQQLVTANPSGSDTLTPALHPNVAWPTDLQNQNAVTYPVHSDDVAGRIYIASRIGSEGVDRDGLQQPILDNSIADELKIYRQASRDLPGFNPNEEHALVAPSVRAQLTGQTAPNIPANAAFALQNKLNQVDRSDLEGEDGFSSEPWVLVEFENTVTGRPDMAAYLVEESRVVLNSAQETINAFPIVDAVTHQPQNPYSATGGVVTTGANYNFSYGFDYEIAAGDLLVAPYPLNQVIGAAKTPGSNGLNLKSNGVGQQTLWWDYKGNAYAVSGGGQFSYAYVYPFRADFDYGGRTIVPGDLIAWLPRDAEKLKVKLTDQGDLDLKHSTHVSRDVLYRSYWGTTYPKLKRGESLVYQGGENKADNPASEGLPAIVGMASAEIVFDTAIPSMVISDSTRDVYSGRIVRPLDAVSVPIAASVMPTDLQPAATTNVMVAGARWYFRNLPGSLSGRVYYDSLSQQLVLRGKLNGMESGDANLTSGIEALNVLEPSFLSQSEFDNLLSKTTGKTKDLGSDWNAGVKALYKLSQNPKNLRDATGMILGSETGAPLYLHGLVNSSDHLATLDTRSKGLEFARASEGELIDSLAKYQNLKTRLESQTTGSAALSGIALDVAKQNLAALEIKWTIAFIRNGSNPLLPVYLQFNGAINAPSGYRPLNSFGAGSVLVPSGSELTSAPNGRRFVTVAENNDARLAGAAVTIHVIEMIPDRYRGGLKVIEPADAFSERIDVKHNAEFGGNTKDLYYEWYIREAAPLDVVAKEVPTIGTANQDVDWQLYAQGIDLNSIQFEGRPDIALADQMFIMRYRHKGEPNNWKLVTLDSPSASDWVPGSVTTPSPFQWSGAANSPQLQADGSKRYIPALVMGWVKRVLDRINPYEARFADMLNNESPAVYSSILQILGKPFIGPVALNSSKNVVEGVGLIELYETVMKRARDLTIDNSQPGAATTGTNQAILLAATRLALFYEILGSEAYADYRDPTIQMDDSGTFDHVLTSIHAFQNQQNGILDEGLSLLRGTDFVTSYPSYNRLFWNYVKGLGEAAYNVNYNITDTNLDGFINEVDARTLYPQGHGDAWGHYLSGSNMHYALLLHNAYTWRSRAELYALLDNVIEADYLDEKTFVKNAAAKARAGRDIVQESYRKAYSANPDGQWQGYDDPNEARAWGLGDWARRAGQGAYFDFLTGNAILPESASATLQDDFNDNNLSAKGLAVIERAEASDGLGEIAANFAAIQNTLDQAASGMNPLGLRSDSISFDIDPTLQQGSDEGIQSHFEQVYAKAVTALSNAERSTRISSEAGNKLRRISDDTALLTAEVYDNDLAFRSALVGIFGRPHAGNVGFGKVYPEGYDGPDTTFYNYIANVNAKQQELPWGDFLEDLRKQYKFSDADGKSATLFFDDDGNNAFKDLYKSVFDETFTISSSTWETRFRQDVNLFLNQEVGEGTQNVDFSDGEDWYIDAQVLNDWAFQAEPKWGARPAYGELQLLLEEMLLKEVEISNAWDEYQGYMGDYVTAIRQAEIAIELGQLTLDNTKEWQIANGIHITVQAAADLAGELVEDFGQLSGDALKDAFSEAFPKSLGFSNDVTSPLRAAAIASGLAVNGTAEIVGQVFKYTGKASELIQAYQEIFYEIDAEQIEVLEGMIDAVAELEYAAGDEGALRIGMQAQVQELEIIRQQFVSKLNEGFALLKEREAFNTGVAGDAQRNRYLDMMLRLTRNEAQVKHSLVLENARRYTWLAAKAYEYEVNPLEGSAASATGLLEDIVKAGSVGTMVDGVPTIGGGGLSEVLAILKANHAALEGQLGINNPQEGLELISLRKELFRIGNTEASSAVRWKETLKNHKVENLWDVPAFANYCRPFAVRGDEPQPGLVIPFSTNIESGKNFFGHSLLAGDHSFSSSNYSTKIASLGVWFKDYSSANLASAPRIYLVPVGQDFMRTSNAGTPVVRAWNLVEQVIPTPFALNSNDLSQPGFIPSFDGVDGIRGNVRRHGDFRAFATDTGQPDSSGMIRDSRLIGRSVWNSRWLMIIPGATLGTDGEGSLDTFAEDVSDIMLNFSTYTHRGL
jgi:subtilisin-like proprotein convertase family protein